MRNDTRPFPEIREGPCAIGRKERKESKEKGGRAKGDFQGKEKLKMSFMEGTEQLLADKGIEDFGGER